ncbi:MAG: PqqD family peptide modification chaperone [Coriobacteriia bacterium]|nr:PqqD family peptide modification chaperone [Coriobacteriia bacterium]
MTPEDHGKDRYNFVLYVPEIRHQEFRVNDAGRVVLNLEINPAKRLMGKLVKREPVSDIELDPLSSSAWLSIDGARSILDIARIQSEKTGDDIDESARRIAAFMRYVAKRGWIRFKEVKQG